MEEILNELSQHPIRTRVSLTGTLVVGRDIAHAKIKERLDSGESMPQYLKDHPVYYAGPAKTPEVSYRTSVKKFLGKMYLMTIYMTLQRQC